MDEHDAPSVLERFIQGLGPARPGDVAEHSLINEIYTLQEQRKPFAAVGKLIIEHNKRKEKQRFVTERAGSAAAPGTLSGPNSVGRSQSDAPMNPIVGSRSATPQEREICRHYQNGNCRRGDNCRWLHAGPVNTSRGQKRLNEDAVVNEPPFKRSTFRNGWNRPHESERGDNGRDNRDDRSTRDNHDRYHPSMLEWIKKLERRIDELSK